MSKKQGWPAVLIVSLKVLIVSLIVSVIAGLIVSLTAASMLVPVCVFADDGTAGDGDTSRDLSPEAYNAKWDPRPDKVSKVRNQYWGTCWAQGAISTAESYLIKNKLMTKNDQMSVEDVLWWAQGESCNHKGGWMLKSRNDGGYALMATGYLATAGLRSEKDIPYIGKPKKNMQDYLFYNAGKCRRPKNYFTAPYLFEVTDMEFQKSKDPLIIKDMIVKYGAVTSYYADSKAGLNKKKSSYWMPLQEGAEPNHCISIVGWDDNFSKEDFVEWNGKKPEHDGAWLIKNSYGTGYTSDGGFHYISYDDGYLLHVDELTYQYSVVRARKPAGLKKYILDQFGGVAEWQSKDKKVTAANVFNFGKGEKIKELSFTSMTGEGGYHLYYAPVTDGGAPVIDESKWQLLAEGALEFPGYHTVKAELDGDVPTGKGAVILVIESKTPGGASLGTDQPLVRYDRMIFNPVVDRKASYVLDGSEFKPATVKIRSYDEEHEEEINFSIRAYTDGRPVDPPKKSAVKKLKPLKKAFRATWKKVAGVTGYQLQYSTNKKFTKNRKTATIKGAKTTSGKIRRLKPKKTYYVRVRTYKTLYGKVYRSAWSKAKKVKTKK